MNWLRTFLAPGPPVVELAGPRVVLRTPQSEYWREWSDLRAQSRRFLQPWEPTWAADSLSRDAYRRRLRQYARDWEADEGYSFLIFAGAHHDELVGGIALTNVRRGVADSAMIGYWMGERHAGQGLMSAALPLLLDFAFGKLGLNRLEAACLEHNDRSRALLLKTGFQYEGLARGLLKIDGAWRDHSVFAILRDDPRKPKD